MTTEDCYLIASDDVLFSLSPETERKPGDIQMMVAVFRWKDGEFFVYLFIYLFIYLQNSPSTK